LYVLKHFNNGNPVPVAFQQWERRSHAFPLGMTPDDYVTTTHPAFTKFGEKMAHVPSKKPLDFGGNRDRVTGHRHTLQCCGVLICLSAR